MKYELIEIRVDSYERSLGIFDRRELAILRLEERKKESNYSPKRSHRIDIYELVREENLSTDIGEEN